MSIVNTSVVDASSPSAEDLQSNSQLISLLLSLDNFESEEEGRRRKVVLGKISELFRE